MSKHSVITNKRSRQSRREAVVQHEDSKHNDDCKYGALTEEEEAVSDEGEELVVFRGHNGHTLRRYPYVDSSDCEVQLERKYPVIRVDPESNATEIPITEIDSMFDAGFWQLARYQSVASQTRALNTQERWLHVEHKLQDLAIKIEREFEPFYNRMVTHYHVPVVGHYLLQHLKDNFNLDHYPGEKKKARAPKNFLHFNGKFYDPMFIYELVDDGTDKAHLKVVCPCGFSNQLDVELTPTEELRSGKRRPELIGKGTFSEISNRSTNKSRNSHHKNDYLQLDLHEVCDITHIGSLGGYPTEIYTFPKPPERTREDYTRRAGSVKRYQFNGVNVVKYPHKLSWVSNYRVEYRDVHSGLWMKYGDVFNGNFDISNEVKNEVNLRAQHIRIYPQEFHYSQEMRVRLYGTKLSSQQATVGNGVKETIRGKNKVETVVYTINPRIDSVFRLDGNGYRKSSYYYEGIKTRNNRKNCYRKDIKEDISAM